MRGVGDVDRVVVLGYMMSTGRLPFEGRSFAGMDAKSIGEAVTPIRKLAPGGRAALAEAIEKCLRKEPNDRFRRARELSEAMEPRNNRSILANAVTWTTRVAMLFGVAGSLAK